MMFKKKQKEAAVEVKEEKPDRLFHIKKLGIKASPDFDRYHMSFDRGDIKHKICADELEAYLKVAFEAGRKISEATGQTYIAINHKDSVPIEAVQEVLNATTEEFKAFKASENIAELSRRIGKFGINLLKETK